MLNLVISTIIINYLTPSGCVVFTCWSNMGAHMDLKSGLGCLCAPFCLHVSPCLTKMAVWQITCAGGPPCSCPPAPLSLMPRLVRGPRGSTRQITLTLSHHLCWQKCSPPHYFALSGSTPQPALVLQTPPPPARSPPAPVCVAEPNFQSGFFFSCCSRVSFVLKPSLIEAQVLLPAAFVSALFLDWYHLCRDIFDFSSSFCQVLLRWFVCKTSCQEVWFKCPIFAVVKKKIVCVHKKEREWAGQRETQRLIIKEPFSPVHLSVGISRPITVNV